MRRRPALTCFGATSAGTEKVTSTRPPVFSAISVAKPGSDNAHIIRLQPRRAKTCSVIGVNRKARLTVVIVFLALGRASAHDWDRVQPRITSEVQTLTPADATALLTKFCAGSVKAVERIGLTCSTQRLGTGFSDIIDAEFHPEGVIYGHFLSPTSDDAAVSGWSAEHHPDLWGGTLLLTKSNGAWKPLWYRSAVITHSCRKLPMPSGREVLLCEAEDGGMGHVLHYVFSVDLTAPVRVMDSLLAVADSYSNPCFTDKRRVERVEWDERRRRLNIEIRTPERSRKSTPECADEPIHGERPPLRSTRAFLLSDKGFRPGVDQR